MKYYYVDVTFCDDNNVDCRFSHYDSVLDYLHNLYEQYLVTHVVIRYE